ncbi:MAG: hypothetical protein QW609_00095 [Candidatus Aenigmatarchaeota archaeon]
MKRLSEKYSEFKLIDLPTNKFYVVLEPEIQRDLIKRAASKFGGYGSITKLAKYLKLNCKSIRYADWKKSIRDNYIPLWKKGKKSIPMDCLIKLCELADKNLKNIESFVIKIITKATPRIDTILSENAEKIDENNIKFLNYFYGINTSENNVKRFQEFIKVIKLVKEGYRTTQITQLLNLPKGRVNNWIYKGSIPKIALLLKHYLESGNPGRGNRWLSINNTGWRFKGPWIKVPTKIKKYSDILFLLKQLQTLPDSYTKANKFNLQLSLQTREKLFGYLLGVLVGDSNKDRSHKSKLSSKRIVLELAKTHPSNLRMGEFITFCANSLHLKMKRVKDRAQNIKGRKKHSYCWKSQSTPLVHWIVSVCLGLKEGETTTYTPIDAKWILSAPKHFKIAFLQGVFDSDGWVDLNQHQVGVITGPNTKLIKELFKTLNINFKESKHPKNPTSLLIKLKDAFNLSVFNPIIRSYRYYKLNELIKAKRYKKWPPWLSEKVKTYITSGLKNSEIVDKILNEDFVAIMGQTIRFRRRILNEK